MKKLVLGALLLGLGTTVFGATLQKGLNEAKLEASTDFRQDAYDFVPLQGTFGYFIADNLEVGGLLGFRKAAWKSYWVTGSVWTLGAFGEYHFDVDFPVHPYVGASIAMLDGEKGNDTVAQATASGGVKLFLSESFAVSAAATLNWSDKEIYNVDVDYVNGKADRSGDQVGVTFELGLRYYF